MTAGRIAIDKRMLAAALVAVPLLLFVGVMAAREGSVIVGGALFIGTLVCFVGVLPGLSPALDVVWDDQGVAGPAQVWGPFIGLRRAAIGWDEIARLGGTGVGYVYLESTDGRRLYWTEQHRHHDQFFAVVRRRRPDLLQVTE